MAAPVEKPTIHSIAKAPLKCNKDFVRIKQDMRKKNILRKKEL